MSTDDDMLNFIYRIPVILLHVVRSKVSVRVRVETERLVANPECSSAHLKSQAPFRDTATPPSDALLPRRPSRALALPPRLFK